MFLGHFGVAMAAKRVAPRPSLGTLLLAAQWADGIWPVFLMLGLETVRIVPGYTVVTPLEFVSYPYTHSLLADVLWALLFGGVYYARRRDMRGALWLALLVLSHWVLDVIAHAPDMPTWPEGPKLGLGLWNSLPATIVVEFGLYAVGAALYARLTRARDATGTWAWWSFVLVVAALFASSLVGPPPPSPQALAWVGFAGWLLVAWGYWIERHRRPRTNART